MADPKYQQIADELRAKIESGELPKKPDGPLPTELELREEFGASRNTVRDAIKWLINLAWSRPVRVRGPTWSRRSTHTSPR